MMHEDRERSWKAWLFRWVLLTAIAGGGWFAKQVWEEQKTIVQRLNVMDVDRASAVATKFSTADWAIAKAAIDEKFNASDRRMWRLEENSVQINKSLERIENRLGTK